MGINQEANPNEPIQWPSPNVLVNGFISRADLLESGRYLKVQLPSVDAKIATVWINDLEVEDATPQLMRDAVEMYPNKSSVDALAALLSLALFECLDSLPEGAKNIEFKRAMFFAIAKDEDEPLNDWAK